MENFENHLKDLSPEEFAIFGKLMEVRKEALLENRWHCVNFCIGYYGQVTAAHINAINCLYSADLIEL